MLSVHMMRPIATEDVAWSVCVSVCPLVTFMSPAKTDRYTDQDPVRGVTHLGPRNHLLDDGQDRTNPFAATRDGKSAMRPFVEIIWPLIIIIRPHRMPAVYKMC